MRQRREFFICLGIVASAMMVVILGLLAVDRNREGKQKVLAARAAVAERLVARRHTWSVTISPKGGADSKIALDDRDPIYRLRKRLKDATNPVFTNSVGSEENDLGVIFVNGPRIEASSVTKPSGLVTHLSLAMSLGHLHVLKPIKAGSKGVGVRVASGGKLSETAIDDADSLTQLQENLCQHCAESMRKLSVEEH